MIKSAKEWIEELERMVSCLRQAGVNVVRYEQHTGLSEEQLILFEQRLGQSLPRRLRELLAECQAMTLLWDMPKPIVLPERVPDMSGEMEWNIEEVGIWIDPMENASHELMDKHYLTFGYSGSGDPILLDVSNNIVDSPVVCYMHELGQYITLADNLDTYMNKLIQLYGAWVWDWHAVTDEQGIDLDCEPLRLWRAWMHRFIGSRLEEVRNLDELIEYACYHGIESEAIKRAFEGYDKKNVFRAWYKRLVDSPSQLVTWAQFIGPTAREGAADWVRSLWKEEIFEAYLSRETFPDVAVVHNADQLRFIRASLSHYCLPVDEALTLVFHDLEERVREEGKLNGFMANAQLRIFETPRVIERMRSWIQNPIDGWDSLYVHSRPSSALILEWLDDSEISQKVVIGALTIMINKNQLPECSREAVTQIRERLEQIRADAVLRSYKRKISAVLEYLDQA